MLGIEKITYRAKVISRMWPSTINLAKEVLETKGNITFLEPIAKEKQIALKNIGVNTVMVSPHRLKFISTNQLKN